MLFTFHEGRAVVLRTFPVMALIGVAGLLVSLMVGFLLASWTVAGIVPAHAAPPAFASSEPQTITDKWREAGYERIGLWEQPRAEALQAAGSSRL